MSARTALRHGGLMVAAAICFTCLHAQQRSPSAQEAQDLAQRVDRHYNRLHSLKAGFTETYEAWESSEPRAGRYCCSSPGA